MLDDGQPGGDPQEAGERADEKAKERGNTGERAANRAAEGAASATPERSEDENLRQRVQTTLADVVRRTVGASLGAVFSTEEGIRKLVSDFSLPKDVTNFVVSQAHGTRDEIFKVVAGELRKWLDRLDLPQEVSKVLSAMALEVKTEIRFVPVPNPEGRAPRGVRPEVKSQVSLQRANDEGGDAPATQAAPASDEDEKVTE